MVVDQRLLKSQMMKYNIGSNVLNKLSEVQQKTQPTNTSVATATDTPITQTRGTQGLQQQPETYKVITNKFPTYDIKDLMGFGPQAVKNQLGFANTVSQYNRLQKQAEANTDPNVRYNLTKPQLTNKQTLQIEQATPETNEQGLKINKTNSFKDLVIDLQNVANQGRSLEFMKFRELYPEYVENWDKVVDLFESIKANPQYSAEQVTTTAQKAYPELFGINDNYSDSDKMSALKRLYDEMVSNKQNGIQLTQQDIIDRYPEYANTEDINTVMELQDFINKDKKSTPTFIDVYDISKEFKSLTKGDVEVGNTEKEQIKKDLANLDKLEARQYNYLSDEGKEYVKLLGAAKAITDELKKNYWIPNDVSERDVLQEVKNKYPDIYSQLTNGVSENVQVSDKDRKLLEGGSTAKSAGKYFKGNLLEFIINTEAGLGDLISTLGNANADFYRDLATALGHGDEWNDEKFREGSTLLGDTLTRAAGWQKEDLENAQRYKEFQEENQKSFKQAMKDGDWTTMIGKSVGLIGQTLPALIASAASGGATGVGFATFLPSSYERALEDLEADESIKLTDNQKRGVALLMGSVESAIEEMSLNMMFPGLKAEGGLAGQVLNKIPGMKNALLRFAVQTELGAASESMEEVAQEFSNNLIAKAAGSDRDMGEFKDYRDIFTETFLSSQLISALGGAGEGINQAKINQIQQQIQEQADLRNKVLEGQAIMANDFNEFANAVEVVPGTTTEELQQVWNNAQQKKQDLENKANGITSNSYNNVNVPSYERTTVKENEQPKLSAKDSQEYTDLLDEMEKNGEITKEDRKKVEMSLGVFTRNTEKTEQPQTEGLANIQKTNETKSETSTEEKRNIIDRIVDKGASIVTKTVSAQDKLYKAQEPRMNVLSNKKNLEKRRANSDRANELIVENGYKPTNTEERLNAHQATLNKLWDQVKEQVKQGEGITVDQTPIINALSEYIAEKKKLGIAGIESEIKALERELNAMKKSQEQGKTDLPVLEQKKQVFNDMIDWKEQEASEVYKGGLRLLTHEIGKVEDDLISKIPGEFTKLKQDVGALLDTYEDVFKAHMKNQRSKGIGLTETYSRIEGIGDMLQGIIGVFKGEGGKVISGAGKVLLGKSLARAKDVDFLIKKGFEELSNEMGSNTKNDNDTTTDKNDTPPTKPNKPKNNGPKNPDTTGNRKKIGKENKQSGTSIQGMAEINQNKKTETKGLGEISNMKQPTLFQKGKGKPITKKQVTQLVKQLKKTGLAKDVKIYETQEDFEKAMEEEDARLQSVWHGSAANFDIFDSSHMGEGEGAQAHGWGHYVAVDEKTGRHYAEMRASENEISIKGDDITDWSNLPHWKKSIYNYLDNYLGNFKQTPEDIERVYNMLVNQYTKDVEHFRELVNQPASDGGIFKINVKDKAHEDFIMKNRRDALEDSENALEFLESLDPQDIIVESAGFNSNLYKVDIPDPKKANTPTGKNYIEEGKKLTEKQRNKFRDELKKVDNSKKYKMSDGTPVETIDGYYPGQSDTYRLYRQISQVLGGDKEASQFLESLGYDGIHYFGERDGESYVIFGDNALSITDHIQYLKDTNGDIAGATTPDGTVHLIESNLRGDTATHEFSHLLWSYAKKNNPNLYKALQKIAREAPQELKDYVKRTYGEMTDEAFLDEVFAWKQGKYSGIKTARIWYQRMWDAIKNIWNSIKNSFGSKYADLDVFEAYETMSSEELMDRVDKLLKGGKEIGRGKGATQFEVAGDIYSNNFKNWFGDWENGEGSKIVDENGKPLKVYHGTESYGFTIFKGRDFWDYDNDMEATDGIYFTDDKSNAKGYENVMHGDEEGTNKGTYEVYLSIKNPLVVDYNGSWWNGKKMTYTIMNGDAEIKTFLDYDEAQSFKKEYDSVNGTDTTMLEESVFNNGLKSTQYYVQLAKKQGNDGVIFKNIRDSGVDNRTAKLANTYVVFNSNQIKSATDNVGTYDLNNPDIRYEKIGGLSNMQIRKFAVQQGLAEINNF